MTTRIINRKQAALFAVGAIFLASYQDAIVKSFTGTMPATEVVLARAIVAIPIFAVWIWWRGGMALFPAGMAQVLGRGFILCLAYFSFVLSIAAMPIATSVSIYFTMPFFVAALSGLVLGEAVKAYRWIAISFGFLGVLLMVRPGAESFEPAALLALASALGYAVGQLMSRHVSQTVPPLVMALWQSIVYGVVALGIGMVAPWFAENAGSSKVLGFLLRPWVWPTNFEWFMLFVMGVVATLASVLFVEAYRNAEANFVAPMEYSALLWATLNGMLFFGDFPDVWTMAGATVVIAAGLWMLQRDFAVTRSAAHSTL